jgi:hypothetical protein
MNTKVFRKKIVNNSPDCRGNPFFQASSLPKAGSLKKRLQRKAGNRFLRNENVLLLKTIKLIIY